MGVRLIALVIPACEAHASYFTLLSFVARLALQYFFSNYLINGKIFGEKVYRTSNVYFDFLYNVSLKYFSSQKVSSLIYIRLNEKYPLFLAEFNLQAPCVLYIGQAFHYSPENNAFYTGCFTTCVNYCWR